MTGKTEPLRETYHYILAYHASRGVMPTQREIGEAFGLTPTGAHDRLKRMAARGWLSMKGRQAIVLRGIK